MYDGKRGTAQNIAIYEPRSRLRAKSSDRSLSDVFHQAMNNIMPVLEVKARRVGGNYKVPMEIRPEKASDPCYPPGW